MTDNDPRYLINKLQDRIESQYAEAMRALNTIEKYLEDGSANGTSDPNIHFPHTSIENTHAVQVVFGQTGSRRDRVLNVLMDGKPVSVRDIASATQLSEKEVRGVLYAKDIRDKVRRTKDENGMLFMLKPEE